MLAGINDSGPDAAFYAGKKTNIILYGDRQIPPVKLP